uniref:RING-type E3 ubiquitin transferase n=1 Tax=Clastoptera arizonana TaxID=38151 RepID=A0A1B6BWZ0_9HEMI
MESLTYEELKVFANNIKEAATCPICLDLARPPVRLCKNGHLICKTCQNDLVICPTCRIHFSLMRPVALNNILTLVPRLCINANQGCNHFCNPSSENDHRNWCAFRIINCKMLSCDWKGLVGDITTHLQSHHSDDITFENQVMSFPFCKNRSRHIIIPIMLVNNNLIWGHLDIDVNKKKLLVALQCCPSNKEDSESIIMYELKAKHDIIDVGYKYIQQVIHENDSIEEVFSEELCMAIPFNIVELFLLNESECLEFNLIIKKINDVS